MPRSASKTVALVPIRSSSVRKVGYDHQRKRLFVQFVGGPVYEYLGVPKRDFIDLLHAESAGRFVNNRIKRRYGYHRLPPST